MRIRNYQEWMQAVKEAIHYFQHGGRLSKQGRTARKIIRRLGLQQETNPVRVAGKTWKQYKETYGIV